MKSFGGLLIIVVVIVFIVVVFCGVRSADNSSIEAWAGENNCVVQEYEQCVFDHGPFWFRDKSQRMYKIKLEDGRIFYMRTSIFGNEFLEQK